MRIDAWEKLDDGFVNLFENGAFISAIEYSALVVAEILHYKLVPNIDKKTWFIYLKVSFPKNMKDVNFEKIVSGWYTIRYKDKDFNIVFIWTWTKKLEKNEDNLVENKKNLVCFI